MFKKIKNKILLNAIHHKFKNMMTLKCKKLTIGNEKIFRVYASGNDQGVFGVGVEKDFLKAQLIAMMEYLERYFCFKKFKFKTTNACACHIDLNLAKKNALYELLERDQALLSFYYADQLFQIQDPKNKNPNINYYSLTFDLPIHVVVCRIKSNLGGVAYGFGNGLEISRAMQKSLKEASLILDSENIQISDEDVDDQLAHMVYYLFPNINLKTSLKRFNVNDYKVYKKPIHEFKKYSHEDLNGKLNEKNIPIEYFFEEIDLPLGKKIYFVQAKSEVLQSLFFSQLNIDLNEKRLDLLNLKKDEACQILHPMT